MEEAVKAPVTVGVPLNEVCGSEFGWLRVGGAEREVEEEAEDESKLVVVLLRARAKKSLGNAELKGSEPNTLSTRNKFHFMVASIIPIFD